MDKLLRISCLLFYVVVGVSCSGDKLSDAEKAAGKVDKQIIDSISKNQGSVSNVQRVSEAMVPILKKYNSGELEKELVKVDNGLKYKIVAEGTGEKPKFGERVYVHYYGMLKDGFKFDSSFDRMKPFSFKLGTQGIIPGWNDGISRMRAGATYILFIPPELGYGAYGTPDGSVPPNSELIFFISLMGFQ